MKHLYHIFRLHLIVKLRSFFLFIGLSQTVPTILVKIIEVTLLSLYGYSPYSFSLQYFAINCFWSIGFWCNYPITFNCKATIKFNWIDAIKYERFQSFDGLEHMLHYSRYMDDIVDSLTYRVHSWHHFIRWTTSQLLFAMLHVAPVWLIQQETRYGIK